MLLAVFASAGMSLPSRCLAMGIYVTVLIKNFGPLQGRQISVKDLQEVGSCQGLACRHHLLCIDVFWAGSTRLFCRTIRPRSCLWRLRNVSRTLARGNVTNCCGTAKRILDGYIRSIGGQCVGCYEHCVRVSHFPLPKLCYHLRSTPFPLHCALCMLWMLLYGLTKRLLRVLLLNNSSLEHGAAVLLRSQ
jgi:hypothetical protein